MMLPSPYYDFETDNCDVHFSFYGLLKRHWIELPNNDYFLITKIESWVESFIFLFKYDVDVRSLSPIFNFDQKIVVI